MSNAPPAASPPAPAATPRAQNLIRAWLATTLGLALIGAVLWDYEVGRRLNEMRLPVVFAGVIAALGAIFCMGGAMHLLDRALIPAPEDASPKGPSMLWRFIFLTHKRLLMLLQILLMAAIVGAAGLLFFDKPLAKSIPNGNWEPDPTQPTIKLQ